MNTVVVTGLGVVTPIGYSCEGVLYNINNHMSNFTPKSIIVNKRNEEKTYPVGLIDKEYLKHFMELTGYPAVDYANYAILQALQDSKLTSSQKNNRVIGTSISSTLPNSRLFSNNYELDRMADVFDALNNSVAIRVAHYFELTGPCYSNASACASGLESIITGYKAVRDGDAHIMVCGGTEEYSDHLLKTFHKLGIATKTECKPCEPGRDGTIVSEGAGILILESLESATKRQATIYGTIRGYGETFSTDSYAVSNKDSIYECMNRALNFNVTDNYELIINLHATGTVMGDMQELQAVHKLVADKNITNWTLETYKQYLGHTMGASGAIELALSLKKHNNGTPIKIVKNSFGLGGTNTTLLLSKFA
jgi:3-oxoacyl-(acyl-carrier-protein) synthase